MPACANCGAEFEGKPRGRPASYCSDACRQAAFRAKRTGVPVYASTAREYDPDADPWPPKGPNREGPSRGEVGGYVWGRALRVVRIVKKGPRKGKG